VIDDDDVVVVVDDVMLIIRLCSEWNGRLSHGAVATTWPARSCA
jgi:hypothetical protein